LTDLEFKFDNVTDNEAQDYINALNSIPSPSTYEYYTRIKNREIWLDTPICDECETMKIVKRIIDWNREDLGKPIKDRKPIIFYIHSYGGDLDICYSIIDAIQASKTPVWGVNMGSAYSSAAMIFISCHKRFGFHKSSILFHKGSGAFQGTAQEVEESVKSYQRQVSKISDLIKDFTKYTKKEIKDNIDKDWYVYIDEAISKGACDKVISSFDDILR